MFFPRSIFSALLATCALTKAHTHDVVHDISQGEEQHHPAKKNFHLHGVSPLVTTAEGFGEGVPANEPAPSFVEGPNLRSVPRSGEQEELIFGGSWGDWMGRVEVPLRGYYACGAEVRYEAYLGNGDDSAMNGVKLTFCHHLDWAIQIEHVTIYEGLWGEWLDLVMCPRDYYVIGAQIRYEDYQGTHTGGDDDSAVNGLKLHCMHLETRDKQWILVEEGKYGDWKPAVTVDNKLVYAGEIRFEKNQGSGKYEDDTGMNGLKLVFEEPNDGITRQTAAGEWVSIASGPTVSTKMVTSMTWTQGQSVTEAKSKSVSKSVSAGFEWKAFSAGTEYSGTTSESLANSMSATFSQTETLTIEVACDSFDDGSIAVMWQWQMYADDDDYGPGFHSNSNHYLCTRDSQVPQCPKGLCKGFECQECYDC